MSQTSTPVSVNYSSGVVLSVPVIADRDVIDQLYDYAQYANGLSLSAAAKQLGITPPSTQHRWAIGWSTPAGPEPSPRLVWYDPDKLAGIDNMARRIAAEHPHATEVIVVQGAGWDDWAVAFSGEDHPDDGNGDSPTCTEQAAPAEAAADHYEAVSEV